MSIIQVLRILLARRWVVLITLGVCFGAAVIVGLLLPPRYPAAARVLLDNFKPDPVTGQMISPAGLRSFTGTQLELIKDYRIAGEAVDKLGLTNNAALVAAWQCSACRCDWSKVPTSWKSPTKGRNPKWPAAR